MEQNVLLIAGAVGTLSLFVAQFLRLLTPRTNDGLRNVFEAARPAPAADEAGDRGQPGATAAPGGMSEKAGKRWGQGTQPPPSREERYFRAGMFSQHEKRNFDRLSYLVPAVVTPVLALPSYALDPGLGLFGLAIGLLIGLKLPGSILERKIAVRNADISFYLPLVIEQVAIGVSGSLDVGPCLQRIAAMADERDSHNVVTELVRFVQHYVKSGVPLEEALIEVGTKSGHTELKHTFLALSQVAKHGGEVSRQLQELASAVALQRETKVEAKIKRLELEATGPVGLVFLGFITIVMMGFFLQLRHGMFG